MPSNSAVRAPRRSSISRSLRLTVLSRSPLVIRTNCCVIGACRPARCAARRTLATPEAVRRAKVVAAMLIEPPVLGGKHRGDQDAEKRALRRDVDPPFGEQRET